MKVFFSFSILLFVLISNLSAQDKFKEDSLRLEIDRALDDKTKVTKLLDVANYYRKFDLLKSIEVCEEALILANNLGDNYLIADTYNKLGALHYFIGNYEEASRLYFKALNIAEKADLKKLQFYTYVNIGNIEHVLENLDKSVEYNFKALDIYSLLSSEVKEQERYNLCAVYSNIGRYYYNQGDNDDAITYFKKGIDNQPENKNNEFLVTLYINLGRVYLDMRNTNEAYIYAGKALEIANNRKSDIALSEAYYFLAEYYKNIEEDKKAFENAERSYQYANKTKSKSLRQNATEMLYSISKNLGDWQLALSLLEEKGNLNDSILTERNVSEISKLQMQYEYSKKDEQKELKRKKGRMLVIVSISVLCVLLLTTSLLLYIFKLRAKQVLLEKENIENDLKIKNKELATNAMFLLRNNEMIMTISTQLMELKDKIKDAANRKIIQNVLFNLHSIKDEEMWNEFKYRFNEVNETFYENLKLAHPDLTPNEIRLCAFLSLNMTTKEIASITQQNIRSIEAARTRLRKKLELTNSDVNLIHYLSKF